MGCENKSLVSFDPHFVTAPRPLKTPALLPQQGPQFDMPEQTGNAMQRAAPAHVSRFRRSFIMEQSGVSVTAFPGFRLFHSKLQCLTPISSGTWETGSRPDLPCLPTPVSFPALESNKEDNPLNNRPRGVVAIYPGSFDPITNGHLDLVERGARLFEKLIVAVLQNEGKGVPLFSAEERCQMLREVVQRFPNVEVDFFNGLLVDYAASKHATAILRGIRAISDYEYELQMALMNRRLRPDIETVFLMAAESYSFISSRIVKEVISLGGDISGLVPPSVEARLRDRVLNGKK